MTISPETREAIENEFEEWKSKQYANKNLKERKKLDQFYTTPQLTIQMLERFEDLRGTIVDPTCGCGGLLAGCIIAGADPNKCYGIELDPQILEVCRERLSRLGVSKNNLHLGDALNSDCYDHFDNNYEYKDGKVLINNKQPFKFGRIRI